MRRNVGSLFLLLPSLIAFAIWCRWYWRRFVVGTEITRTSLVPRQLERPRGPTTSKVEFTIPDAVVGYVIGRRGNRIRQIEEETGARIQVKERIGTGEKVVSITGLPKCVESAESAINTVVQDKLSERSEQKESRIFIAEANVGRLIGRRGRNIRYIQRQSGASVSIEEGEQNGEDRLCLITGTSRQIEEALLLIEGSLQTGESRERRDHAEGKIETDRPLTLIPAHLPQTEDYFPVFVSAIDSEGGVWVQPIEQQDPALLETLVQDMTSLYSKLCPQEATVDSLGVGAVCAAPFEADGKWYRAMVTALPTPDTATLLYIDYGDSDTLPSTKLKLLRQEFLSLECQAVRCVLDSLIATGDTWSEDALTFLEELTHCARWKAVMLRVVSHAQNTVVIVDTNTDRDINIAEQMVDKGFAKWVEHAAKPHPPFFSSNHSAGIEERFQGESGSLAGHIRLPGGHFTGFVLAVHSLELVYILPAQFLTNLAELTEKMNAVYGTSIHTKNSSQLLNKGSLLVAVFLSESRQWYRGILVDPSHGNPSQVKVQLVDYGLSMLVPWSSVQLLKDDFYGPFFAVPCSMADISGRFGEEEAVALCRQLALWTRAGQWEKSVIIKASFDNVSGLWNVTLFMRGERTSLNYQLQKRYTKQESR